MTRSLGCLFTAAGKQPLSLAGSEIEIVHNQATRKRLFFVRFFPVVLFRFHTLIMADQGNGIQELMAAETRAFTKTKVAVSY